MKCLVGLYNLHPTIYVVINDDSKCHIGGIEPAEKGSRGPPYVVSANGGAKVGIARSMAEGVWLLARYYQHTPPGWEKHQFEGRDCYWKFSVDAESRVRQDDTWAWIAERLFEKMLRNGKVATFATAADAQHAADMHERDGCPNAPVLDDGLYWASTEPWEWWLHPNAVGDRPMEVFYT